MCQEAAPLGGNAGALRKSVVPAKAGIYFNPLTERHYPQGGTLQGDHV